MFVPLVFRRGKKNRVLPCAYLTIRGTPFVWVLALSHFRSQFIIVCQLKPPLPRTQNIYNNKQRKKERNENSNSENRKQQEPQ